MSQRDLTLEKLPSKQRFCVISIPSFADDRGTLAAIERASAMPFVPRRFYYLYNLASDARRAMHSHYREQEAILALHGAFTVSLDDGVHRIEYRLDRPDRALHVPVRTWHELYDFSPGTVVAVFASVENFDPDDYCRDYQQFLRERGR